MRLYLSSYGLGSEPMKLAELLKGRGQRVAVIANAADYKSPEEREARNIREFSWLTNINLEPAELDLRDFVGKGAELSNILRDFDLVWIRGGNVFILQRAIEASGFGVAIKQLLSEDVLALGGYSAGACIMTPTLHGIELVDNPNIVPEGYSKEFSWDALDLVNYSIAPHYRSAHPESEAIEATVDYFKAHNMEFRTLQDGEVIVVNE